MQLTDIFDGIYLIHLKELKDRYSNCIREFSKIKLPLDKITIVDGVKHNNGKTVNDRIIGCKLSHIQCIKKAIETNKKHILIFEDDIQFNPAFNNFLYEVNTFIKNKDWDMFYFGGNLKQKSNEPVLGYSKIYNTTKILTTHCYAVNSTIFEELLKIKQGSEYPLEYNDDLINIEKIQSRGKTFVCYPRIAYQSDGISYIRQSKRNYMHLFKD